MCGAGAGVRQWPACAAQTGNPSSATNPFYGSVTLHPATDETLQLSLDDAVRRGLENNLGLKEAESGEKLVKGEKIEALQEFLPTIQLSGGTGVYQHDLAARVLVRVSSQFSSFFPGGVFPAGLTDHEGRPDAGSDQLQPDSVFGPGHFGLAGGGRCGTRRALCENVGPRRSRAAGGDGLSARYCRGERSRQCQGAGADRPVLFDQAHAAHEAGTVANLDELRARVQLQAQQQAVIAAQNTLDKDLILLKREIGVDPGQKIVLTDPTPYSDLATQTPEEVRAVAYKNRQDYQNLQNQLVEFKAIHAAYRSQRLPTLSVRRLLGRR